MSARLVDIFMEMVRIPSESGEEQEFITWLKDLFAKELRAECALDDYGNLIVKVPARNARCLKPVLFGVHADTVRPGKNIEPILEGGVIHSNGETVLGADDKAGIAELFEAVRMAERHPPLEIVVTREEEIGLVGAKHLDMSSLKAKIGFLLDMDALDTVAIGGPSRMIIDVTIKGKAAHAGMEPQKGVSAIKAASYAISIMKEGWIDEETTANVGIIYGGEIRNGVPEKVEIKAECRSQNHDKCLRQSQLIKRIFETAASAIGAKAKVHMELAYKAVKIPEDAEVVAVAKRAVESIGLRPQVKVICGGTDASIYNEKGIQTVAIGTGVRSEHSKEEHIYVEDMEKAVRMICHIFYELSK